jgi:DNA-binding response OmpR family regulator
MSARQFGPNACSRGVDCPVQRVLVIDDDPSVTSVLKRGLAYEGFAVDTAASGTEGLAVARERPPDLVILDVMMPGLDGWEVLRRLLVRAAERAGFQAGPPTRR